MIKEKFDLAGKNILVVGGRGYLGRNFCSALWECGASVISVDLPVASRAALTSKEIISHETIRQYDVDVTDKKSVDELMQVLFNETPVIDVLVYSVTAKPEDFYAPFTECSLEGWKKVCSAELDGLFLIAQQVGGMMEKANKGNMILLSSIYGVVGNDQRIYEGSNLSNLYAGKKNKENIGKRIYSHAAYPAAKGAVIALTRYLAAYWESRNIRVNCISPGGVQHEGENQIFVEKYSARVPLRRKAKVEEISSAVVFLASDASSYINGHNLIVDGGWTVW